MLYKINKKRYICAKQVFLSLQLIKIIGEESLGNVEHPAS